MQDQIEKIKSKLNVMILKATNAKEIDSECKLVFAHPELFVSANFRTSPLLKREVKALVIDEAHLVIEWYVVTLQNTRLKLYCMFQN